MSTSTTNAGARGRSSVPEAALAMHVRFDAEMMWVTLVDGRVIGTPIAWFPTLANASPDQRNLYRIGARGRSLHWENLDEDLSVAGLLCGADPQSM